MGSYAADSIATILENYVLKWRCAVNAAAALVAL
jgi:hypothetical protein